MIKSNSYVLGFESLEMARAVAEALAFQLRLPPVIGKLDDKSNPHSAPIYTVSFEGIMPTRMTLALVMGSEENRILGSGILVAHAPETPPDDAQAGEP